MRFTVRVRVLRFFGSSVDIQQWEAPVTAGVSWLRMSIEELVNSAETDGKS